MKGTEVVPEYAAHFFVLMLSWVTSEPFWTSTPMLESKYGVEKSTTLARSGGIEISASARSKLLVRPATSWANDTFLTVTDFRPAMFARFAARQYSYPLLIEDGVVPFHQPWEGRVVSTVSVPAVAGLILMLPFLLVTLQSPKPPEDLEEELEPQAAKESVSTSADVKASVRLRCMKSLSLGGWKPRRRVPVSRLAVSDRRVKDIGVRNGNA